MRTARERQQRTRGILGGALMGLMVAGTLALPSVLPPAVADDEPFRTMLKTGKELLPRRVDGNAFVKPEWTVEPWVRRRPSRRRSCARSALRPDRARPS